MERWSLPRPQHIWFRAVTKDIAKKTCCSADDLPTQSASKTECYDVREIPQGQRKLMASSRFALLFCWSGDIDKICRNEESKTKVESIGEEDRPAHDNALKGCQEIVCTLQLLPLVEIKCLSLWFNNPLGNYKGGELFASKKTLVYDRWFPNGLAHCWTIILAKTPYNFPSAPRNKLFILTEGRVPIGEDQINPQTLKHVGRPHYSLWLIGILVPNLFETAMRSASRIWHHYMTQTFYLMKSTAIWRVLFRNWAEFN